ncbi:hypothetical protein [Plantactinospora sp. CA-290183]|uniref:hypothetical protein n=1 Tax=Plantactinospora sp. CA-290183 TaxID=3240006 RepID=UPI003D8D2D18
MSGTWFGTFDGGMTGDRGNNGTVTPDPSPAIYSTPGAAPLAPTGGARRVGSGAGALS